MRRCHLLHPRMLIPMRIKIYADYSRMRILGASRNQTQSRSQRQQYHDNSWQQSPTAHDDGSYIVKNTVIQARVAVETNHIKVLSHPTSPCHQHFATTTLKFGLQKGFTTISYVCSHRFSPGHPAKAQYDRATKSGNQKLRHVKHFREKSLSLKIVLFNCFKFKRLF